MSAGKVVVDRRCTHDDGGLAGISQERNGARLRDGINSAELDIDPVGAA
jgi:hypothetical protein